MSTPRNTSTSATFSPQITQGLLGDRSGERAVANRRNHDTVVFNFDVLLTVHLSIILATNKLNAQILLL